MSANWKTKIFGVSDADAKLYLKGRNSLECDLNSEDNDKYEKMERELPASLKREIHRKHG